MNRVSCDNDYPLHQPHGRAIGGRDYS